MVNNNSNGFSKSTNSQDTLEKQKVKIIIVFGKLPGLVVNVEDSQSEPWSLDVSSIPVFA
jgi:hypothetical protein